MAGWENKSLICRKHWIRYSLYFPGKSHLVENKLIIIIWSYFFSERHEQMTWKCRASQPCPGDLCKNSQKLTNGWDGNDARQIFGRF